MFELYLYTCNLIIPKAPTYSISAYIYIFIYIHIPFLTKMLAMSIMENELSKRVIVFQFNKTPHLFIQLRCVLYRIPIKLRQITSHSIITFFSSTCSYHRALIDTFIAWLPASVQLNYTVVQFDIFVKNCSICVFWCLVFFIILVGGGLGEVRGCRFVLCGNLLLQISMVST